MLIVKQQRSASKKPQPAKKPISFWDNEDLQRKIVGWAVLCFVLFLIYTYFNYGGLGSFFLDHKLFPGAQSTALVQGRNTRLAVSNSMQHLVTDSGSLKPTYSSQLFTLDRCVKGLHRPPIAGATNDNYAYWCDIKIYQYFVFDQPRCEVVDMLAKNQELDQPNIKPCSEDISSSLYTKARQPFFGGVQANIMVIDADQFRKNGMNQVTYIKGQECSVSDARPTMYCKMDGNPESVDGSQISASAQSVVAVDSSGTYYQK
jgi:hypothetical protein